MQINPINAQIQQTNSFKANLINTPFLQEGFKHAKESATFSNIKNLHSAKDFYDAIRIIKSSKKFNTITFDTDGKKECYALADGVNRLVTIPFEPNWQKGYFAVEIVKKLAEKLNTKCEQTILDCYKSKLEELEANYFKTKQRYIEAVQKMLSYTERTLKQN